MADDERAYPGDTPTWGHVDLTGYRVEAVDGRVGTVVSSIPDEGPPCIVVRLGPPVIGRRVVLPVASIERVDNDDETVHLGHTRDQVEASPEAPEG
jgi:hypothetical protein